MENALGLIKRAREDGALVYAPQNLECPPLYKVEASVIEVEPMDFHEIEGKLVPRKEICDRIGDAAGVDFVAANCGVKTEMHDDEFGRRTVYIGFAQGRVRLSDGSWRQSSIEEYEFDPTLRAKAEGGGEKKILSYMKVARQRASTGARLRVVRQLTGMPTAFEKSVIGKRMGLTFSRIVQNTDYILGTPEGKMMAIAMATGAAQMLYGQRLEPNHEQAPVSHEVEEPPMRDVTEPNPSTSNLASQALERDPFDVGAEPSVDTSPAADPEVNGLINTLNDYIATGMLPKEGADLINSALERHERDPEVLRGLVTRAKTAYDKVIERRRNAAQGRTA